MSNKMNYPRLTAILAGGHPTSGVYNVDADLALTEMTTENIEQDRPTLTPIQVMDTVLKYPAEYQSMTDTERQLLSTMLATYDAIPVKPNNAPQRQALIAILGTQTKSDLADQIKEMVSHATLTRDEFDGGEGHGYSGRWTRSHIIHARGED